MTDVDRFVEDAGLFYERLGLSRTSGRVMGWLLTAEADGADAPELAEFGGFRELAEQGLRAVGDDPARRRRLELMRDMYAFMMDRFPGLLDEWDKLKGER
jgi:hypothetical protein